MRYAFPARGSVGPVHEYLFVPAREPGSAPLVLLHGSDGRETDLLPLAERLSPSAAKIAIRGAVTTPGGHAFSTALPTAASTSGTLLRESHH